jgi:hypothetical protein
VGHLAVFTQPFAVIGRNDNQRVVDLSFALKKRDDPRELAIDIGDFSVVRMASVAFRKTLARQVRRMRVIQMQPCEKRLFSWQT